MDAQIFELFRKQVTHAGELAFYREKWAATGFAPDMLREPGDVVKVPFTTREDLVRAFQTNPPYGGFDIPGICRVNFTPSHQLGLMPVLNTRRDLELMAERWAEAFRRAGITPDDTVQITFSYTVLIPGMLFQAACEEIGARAIPMGPGNTEQQVKVMNDLKVTAL
ncbi:MAG: hypothetical protein H5T97_00625, partial [Firmicutes bacterium]|nr:hypothetical protein [Bacillota bacterium]